MSNKTEMVSVPVALARGLAYPGDDFHELVDQLQAILATPAEDVREICRNDHRCQQAIEYGVEGMAHCPEGQCAMSDVRAVGDEPFGYWCSPHGMPLHGLFNKAIEPATEEYCEVTPLYRHPHRPVVMPERVTTLQYHNPDFGAGHRIGWNACLDEFKRLNP